MIQKIINYLTKLLNLKFIRFSISGSIATIIDISLLYALTEFGQLWYLFSAIISFSVGSFTHYIISHLWVFKSTAENKAREFISFFTIHALNLALGLLLLFLLVEYGNVWYILAKLLTVCISVIINFTLQRKITFKNTLTNTENASG